MDLKQLLTNTTIGITQKDESPQEIVNEEKNIDVEEDSEAEKEEASEEASEATLASEAESDATASEAESDATASEAESDATASEEATASESASEAEKEAEDKLDPRFAKPWNKLEKGAKMNRILLFVDSEKIDKDLTNELTKSLKQLLFKGCENGLFNKLTDVTYNEETGIIESFKNLEFNESSKKYKLKTGSTKNRSVGKSRSNIDRLTKK